MKIIHLIGGGDIGGAKSHVLSLIRELGKHIKVTLISYRKGPFYDDAVNMGIDARVIRTGNIIRDIKLTLELIRENQYDVIHSHGAKANMIASILRRIIGIPVVTTIHSDYRLDYMNNFLKQISFGVINMVAIRKIDYHIGVSDSYRDMLISRRFNPQNIFTVYNGIPFDDHIPPCTRRELFDRYNIPFPEDSILVGIMARLDPVKDHETFIRAAAEVSAANPKVRFIIAGPGDELRPRLEQFAEKMGIRDRICFTGMITEPYDFFQVIDINVLTSISESFPYVILEGARCCRATVSTRVGGLADLIESGVNGYLIEPGDWKALARHLLELSADEEKRTKMGRLLHDKAARHFSLEHMCMTQLDIYERILRLENRKKKDGKLYDITIIGYYGYKNSGDEAILKSIVRSLRERNPDLSFMVFSRKPGETMRNDEVDSVNRFSIFHVIKALKRTRLFMAGGGNLLQDNTSTRSILYYLTMLQLAKRYNAKTMLFANGIGPINRRINRRKAARVLNGLDAITLREPVSLEELKKMGVTSPEIHVTSDPAILLDPIPDEDIDRIMAKEGVPSDRPLIGISVRKWADMSYLDAIAALADYCVDRFNACPVFIPMQHPSDVNVCEAIIKRMSRNAWLIRGYYQPEELLGLISRLTLMIGMRLHSLIYAASQMVPALGLVYEPKVDAFLKEVSQPSAGTPLHMDCRKVYGLLDDLWENRDAMREKLKDGMERLIVLARENVDVAMNLLEQDRNH